MKMIPLTKGMSAMVDDWRFEELNQYTWWVHQNVDGSVYAMTKRSIPMHRVVARTPNGMVTDHINHNTLDNREENLRVCTISENLRNRGKTSKNKRKYKGVFPNHSNWMARIKAGNKILYIGTYKTEEEAALAYDEAAKKHHGEFAFVNFP